MIDTIAKLDELIETLTASTHRELLTPGTNNPAAVAAIAASIESFANARVALGGRPEVKPAGPVTLERQIAPGEGPPKFPPRR